ncbi:MAG: peptidase S9, partial [Aliifodinibius sp.]|nr:peptidase S9 [Fodinibius sp.]NIV12189.1 peptidase S9 [Fodinibius sp.]NIY23647.1 peptidase S9 [Fodinibius sp.]
MTSFIQRAAFLSPGVVLILSFVFSLPSNAQYFGRNKVQYDDFDFQIMHTNNFDVYFYDREAESVKDAARMIERWHSRYTKLLNHKLPPKQPLILYANHADFQQTNVISNLISQGTGGVTEGLERRIVLPLTGAYSDNDHVLGHELVHAFQYHIAIAQKRGIRALSQQPLWFIEGMAEYLSSGSSHPHTAMWMRDAVSHDDVPTIKQVGRDQRYFPYRYGHAIWAYIAGKWGDDVVGPIYRRAMTLSLDSTFQTILGISRDSLSSEWQQALRQTYNSQLEGRTKPNDVGEKILAKDLHAGGMNMAPAISPDGSQVAFLSEKDLFTIDLFLADAHTGKIKKKLVSANTDAHFDALRFMNSAGAWSPDGKLFAFVVFKDGENAISIVEVASGDVKRTIKTDSIGAIYHLSWSPDGRQLVFSGSEAGLSDLYLYNLDRGTTRQLTNDRYADLQPAWSPDGEKIVFVTDRGPGTDMSILKTGPMQLAMFEVKTGEMK